MFGCFSRISSPKSNFRFKIRSYMIYYIFQALTPDTLHDTGLGNTQLSSGFSPVQGFGIEFFLGFVLILVIFGVCDPNKPEEKPAAGLAIGMAVGVGHLATVDFTGASMNPARSFGSALIANNWTNHWVQKLI